MTSANGHVTFFFVCYIIEIVHDTILHQRKLDVARWQLNNGQISDLHTNLLVAAPVSCVMSFICSPAYTKQ